MDFILVVYQYTTKYLIYGQRAESRIGTIIESNRIVSSALATAQAASHQLLTAEVRLRFQVSPCAICGTGTEYFGFPLSISFQQGYKIIHSPNFHKCYTGVLVSP
jgi:hypothetical protein